MRSTLLEKTTRPEGRVAGCRRPWLQGNAQLLRGGDDGRVLVLLDLAQRLDALRLDDRQRLLVALLLAHLEDQRLDLVGRVGALGLGALVVGERVAVVGERVVAAGLGGRRRGRFLRLAARPALGGGRRGGLALVGGRCGGLALAGEDSGGVGLDGLGQFFDLLFERHLGFSRLGWMNTGRRPSHPLRLNRGVVTATSGDYYRSSQTLMSTPPVYDRPEAPRRMDAPGDRLPRAALLRTTNRPE